MLGTCYGIFLNLGIVIHCDISLLPGILITAACGGLGCMIGDIWNETLVRRAAREELEIQELGNMLAESGKRNKKGN